MVKTSKLLSALDAHRNVDAQKERQQKLQKQAAKRKRLREQHSTSGKHNQLNGAESHMSGALPLKRKDENEWKSEGGTVPEPASPKISSNHRIINKVENPHAKKSAIKKSDVDRLHSNQDGVDGEEDLAHEDSPDEVEDGIPLSDVESLPSEEKGDIIPYQRLTINNATALTKIYNSISLPITGLPFSEHQTITSADPVFIPDINDDLARELIFHQQCLTAAREAQVFLYKEDVPFSRPPDYFAEMIKSDEHMGIIKQKMTDEAANKVAAAEARRQRDLKKFGKQVQVAKLQERDKAKRETLEKINILKRKRKNTEVTNAEETDMFDIALDNASNGGRTSTRTWTSEGGRGPSRKHQKDAKFGFGGKKRFAKSGDAVSTSNLRGFSIRQVKGQQKSPQRLGKSRRTKK
ncbi:MAG: hypothetical protein Q9197_001056 [Variospora fuerteventurae]